MPERHDNVLNWATILDPNALEQAKRTARLPFVTSPLALMPDAHVGVGATIGSVVPTEGAIIPSAVGVDIGCGMIAVHTDLTASDLPDDLTELHGLIEQAIPAGPGTGHPDDPERLPGHLAPIWGQMPLEVLTDDRQRAKVSSQHGTLGGGNHFVEISLDEADGVWAVLHSGSRGVGHFLATRHIAAAKGLMKSYFIDIEDPDLAYLVEGTQEFDSYIEAMLWAQDYARANREEMMDRVLEALSATTGSDSIREQTRINCHHNYCEREHHYGRNMWITRKGAIRARRGDYGVIPGSMGTDSYIVRGLGNPSSFCSAAHGAGRTMSRTAARKAIDAEELIEQMAGKSWNEDDAGALIDEAPRAYKPIEAVMADQADLVEVVCRLEQILSYKGTR